MNAVYDNAPRPITLAEAEAIAEGDYGTFCSGGTWCTSSRGADGGMHFRGIVTSREAADRWVRNERAAYVERILSGQANIAYNPSTDRFFSC